jgi:branched-chain amino acid transport system permease protein
VGWALVLGPAVAAIGALIIGWFCIRLSGVYLAMLTLAFAQIVWSVVFQWDDFTGGSNGLIGLWPPAWLDGNIYYYFVLAVVVFSAWAIRRILFSPFGYAIRACRDSALRAGAIGIDVQRVQWLTFILSGAFAGLSGALFVFSKGSVGPEVISIAKSVDALVMVLLGGLQTLMGPVVGAAVFHLLQDYFMGATQYWHALFGGVILVLVLLAPHGIVGSLRDLAGRWKARHSAVGEKSA